MRRKSQIALEFLMTYGWAILVVMVALGALAYFGVLNPSRVLPERCLFGNGINCQDYILYSNNFSLSLLNGMGQSLYGFYISPDGFTGSCLPDSSHAMTIAPDAIVLANCTFTSPALISGQKGKVKMKANFKKVANGFNQVAMGELYATVQ